jgi:hypothetical protein
VSASRSPLSEPAEAEVSRSSSPDPVRSAEGEGGAAKAASTLVSDTLTLARDVVGLAAAEVRLAALSGLTMLMLVIVTAVLVIMAWGSVAAVVAYVLVAVGLPVAAAGLLVAAAHGVAAFLLWRTVVRLSRSLTLPELRRSLLSSEE